jgi:hypothetical protein
VKAVEGHDRETGIAPSPPAARSFFTAKDAKDAKETQLPARYGQLALLCGSCFAPAASSQQPAAAASSR